MTAADDAARPARALAELLAVPEHLVVDLFAALAQPAVPRLACTVREAAEALGVSDDTVYKLIRSGEFPARRVGARTLVSVEHLRSWVNEASNDPASWDGGADGRAADAA